MKESFFKKHGKAIGIIAAIICFATITLAYFPSVLEGKRVKQHDIEMWKGMSQETVEHLKTTGEQTLWTNSMFGGMPTWNISTHNKSNLFLNVHNVLSLGLPDAIGAVFVGMLGFFLLLMVLDCSIGISVAGALAYGFTSYMFIIIGAGHNTKAYAMAYMAPVIAGIILAYKGKFIKGAILTAFALALEIRSNHLQITYYLLLICIILVIAQFISDMKEKQLGRFFKASAGLLVAVILAVLTNSTILYANYEYGKETTRGKPVLTQDETNQTSGLDRDYITQWSYGIGETWSLLIPNAKGGASAYIGDKNPALDKVGPQFKQNIAQSNAYWGDQPGTSGPVYAGAIVVFLFLIGALTVEGKMKWALLAATVLSILLSWGKNFMGFTDFFIDFVPGYNKFRAVSMTLVIAELCIPLLGFLGLAEIFKSPEDFKKNTKKIFIALGVTVGICIIFSIAPRLFFNFLSKAEAEQFARMQTGENGAIYATFFEQLQNVRIAIFRKDATRSLVFIILSAIPLFLYGTKKIKQPVAAVILAVLILIDMFPIDKRYMNSDYFIPRRQFDKPFAKTHADEAILTDNSLDYRVLDLTKDMFNDASTSYYHKSIGGYHGAKMQRYQDLINGYLTKEIQNFSTIFKNSRTNQELADNMKQQKVLNMLNTKYIIYNPEMQPILNTETYGNAWMVNDIKWAGTPNEEFDAIATTDTRHTAIISNEFKDLIGNFTTSDSTTGEISITDYKPNKLTYNFMSDKDRLVIFSEIWSGEDGWHMTIDGEEHPIIRADYLLRSAVIPAGNHKIVMSYEPKIWKTGNTLSLVSSLLIIIGALTIIITEIARKRKESAI